MTARKPKIATPEEISAIKEKIMERRVEHLENRLQAILLIYKNNDVAGIDVMAQVAIDALIGIPRFAELLSRFGAKSNDHA